MITLTVFLLSLFFLTAMMCPARFSFIYSLSADAQTRVKVNYNSLDPKQCACPLFIAEISSRKIMMQLLQQPHYRPPLTFFTFKQKWKVRGFLLSPFFCFFLHIEYHRQTGTVPGDHTNRPASGRSNPL